MRWLPPLVLGVPASAAPACDPAYPTVCIPPPPPDLDCAEARRPGSQWFTGAIARRAEALCAATCGERAREPQMISCEVPYRRFAVLPPDPHRFDGDHDGVGCESD